MFRQTLAYIKELSHIVSFFILTLMRLCYRLYSNLPIHTNTSQACLFYPDVRHEFVFIKMKVHPVFKYIQGFRSHNQLWESIPYINDSVSKKVLEFGFVKTRFIKFQGV